MYGYPEQFIPMPELVGYGAAPHVATPRNGRCAPGDHQSGGDGVKKSRRSSATRRSSRSAWSCSTLGFPSLSISEVKGSGRQKGITERYRGAELTNYLRPKVKIECVVADRDVQTVVDTILKHARTGAVGDGKVFVIPVEEATASAPASPARRSSRPTRKPRRTT